MPGLTGSWTRLFYDPVSGKLTVQGNPFPVLGVTDAELFSSAAPLSLLPDAVVSAILNGGAVVEDDHLNVLIIPDAAPSVNAATLVREARTEADYVSDIAAGVVGFDANGTISRWNRRMAHLFGPREEDARGKSAEEVLPQPVLYNWRSIISSATLGHEVKVEFRPSGEKRVEGVLSRGGPGVIGLFYDSTENYRTGKRLRASNRLNQAYLQSTGIGILLLDAQLRILLSNRGFAGIFREEGTLIGLNLKDVLPDNSCEWLREASEKLSNSHVSEVSERLDTEGAEGERINVKHTLRVIRNESNQPVNFVCLFEDRTELNSLGSRVREYESGLAGLTLIAESMQNPSMEESFDICTAVIGITGASAVAMYGYDRYDSMRLMSRSGEWPDGFPPDEPAGLGFPAYVWNADKCCILRPQEHGVLAGRFERSLIVPMGRLLRNRGFFVICDPPNGGAAPVILSALSSITGFHEEAQFEKPAERVSEKADGTQRKLVSSLLDALPLPAALFNGTGEPVFWNPAMTELTGVSREEAKTRDMSFITDPENKGITLDTLASENLPYPDCGAFTWPIKRADGTVGDPFGWHVSMIELQPLTSGGCGYLMTGVPCGPCEPSGKVDTESLSFHQFFDAMAAVLSSRREKDVIEAVSGFIRGMGLGVDVQIEPAGETDGCEGAYALFPIAGKSYRVMVSDCDDHPLLQKAVQLLSSCAHLSSMGASPSTASGFDRSTASVLVEIVTGICMDSVGSANALIGIAGNSDPFSGYARTLLLANENMLRAVILLHLLLKAGGDYEKADPGRFLAEFHRVFAGKGIRPPALLLEDRLPSVSLLPKVVCEALSALCRIASGDGVVTIEAKHSKEHGRSQLILCLSGLDPDLVSNALNTPLAGLALTALTPTVEAGILTGILADSGCRLFSLSSQNICFAIEASD